MVAQLACFANPLNPAVNLVKYLRHGCAIFAYCSLYYFRRYTHDINVTSVLLFFPSLGFM